MSGYCDECGNTLCVCHLPDLVVLGDPNVSAVRLLGGPSPAEQAVIDAAREVAETDPGGRWHAEAKSRLYAAVATLDAQRAPDEVNEDEET